VHTGVDWFIRPTYAARVPEVVASPVRLTPQERLEWLCDLGSLESLAYTRKGVGVQAACGRVNGQPIVCYAQDSRVAGGSVGTAEAELIVQAQQCARRLNAPVVAFLESAGARLQEGTAALGGFGRIFRENVALSGHVPQVSVVTGTSAGGGCYSPALTDFVVMTQDASMFLTGPKIVRQALGEEVTASVLGGVQVQERNGVCEFVAADDGKAIALCRELLGYLPAGSAEPPTRDPGEPAPDVDPGGWLPTRARSFYDVRLVIQSIVDGGRFLEVARRWAKNMVVGFARIEGRSIGVVANQPSHLGGVIDVDASQKGAKFVGTCDSFGIPLVVLVDTPGFMPGTRQERAGIIRHGAGLLRAFSAATVPRFTVILRKAFGGAFITMNCKDLGADASFAWPASAIGVMGARPAIEIIHRRRLLAAASPEREAQLLARRYERDNISAEAALQLGAIDAIVEPWETRSRLAAALAGEHELPPASPAPQANAAARNEDKA
jgi:acetyl-CoA carboxylase carboxyltransferase component